MSGLLDYPPTDELVRHDPELEARWRELWPKVRFVE